jgi:predicted nucleic acid-binding protein
MRDGKRHRITREPEKFSNNGNLAHDGNIAALIVEHGVGELWTTDHDFARFPGIRVRDPFNTQN